MTKMLFTDDFEEAAELSRRVTGEKRTASPAGGPSPSESDWSRLSRGQTLGKRVVVQMVPAQGEIVAAPVNMLTVGNESDETAMNLGLTLHPPEIITIPGTLPDNIQSASGEQDNIARLGDGGTNWPLMQALVEWGIGGVQGQATVDFVNGATMNLQASWVRVGAIIINDGFLTRGVMVVRAQLGPSHSAPSRAQTTVLMDDIVAHGLIGNIFPIPRYAKDVNILLNNIAAAVQPDFDIIFFRGPNVAAPLAGRAIYSSAASGVFRYGEPCPIPDGAFYYAIRNTQAAQGATYRAVFNLAI